MTTDAQRQTQVIYALGRLPNRTYVSRTFRLGLQRSRDAGEPALYVTKVFDDADKAHLSEDTTGLEWSEELVTTSPAGRMQIKLQVARASGHVRELRIQKVPADLNAEKMVEVLRLDRAGSARLIELIRKLDDIPVVNGQESVRMDDQLLWDISRDPSAISELYGRDPERFRALIESDVSARDVVAAAHRRAVVGRFRELLSSGLAFEEARVKAGGSRERVWQQFLEENPWILGLSLAGQLLTAWSDKKLEQVVAGFSVAAAGKRADALLRTNGQIRSLVFAEIKHHETQLLTSGSYRPGCWGPSSELSGGVVQAQQTVYAAARDIGERLADRDMSGAETGEATFLVRPRSFLILGHLGQLQGEAGGVHREKYRSFEIYRRNLLEPEVLTFDELLARAEWHVSVATVGKR